MPTFILPALLTFIIHNKSEFCAYRCDAVLICFLNFPVCSVFSRNCNRYCYTLMRFVRNVSAVFFERFITHSTIKGENRKRSYNKSIDVREQMFSVPVPVPVKFYFLVPVSVNFIFGPGPAPVRVKFYFRSRSFTFWSRAFVIVFFMIA